MIIGFLISGRLISHRIETMKGNYEKTGFGKEIMRIIDPTPTQREKLGPVFREYAKNNHDLMNVYHEDQKELYIELKEDLKEILNKDQIERLDNHWNYRKKRYQRGDSTRKHRGMRNKPSGRQ